MIRCNKCNWRTFTTGMTADLEAEGLTEVKKGCTHCGGRSFKCPKCGNASKMFRMKKAP